MHRLRRRWQVRVSVEEPESLQIILKARDRESAGSERDHRCRDRLPESKGQVRVLGPDEETQIRSDPIRL